MILGFQGVPGEFSECQEGTGAFQGVVKGLKGSLDGFSGLRGV